jgi:hypothetical protein
MTDKQAYQKQWKETHPGWNKAWRERNKQHLRDYMKKWHADHLVEEKISNYQFRESHREWWRNYMKKWRAENKDRLKLYDKNYWLRKHPKGGENVANYFKGGKSYTVEEVISLLKDQREGKLRVRYVAETYGRTLGAANAMCWAYRAWQKGRKTNPTYAKIFQQVGEIPSNNHTEQPQVVVSVESDPLAKFDVAFQNFQTAIVELIDSEVSRRVGNVQVEWKQTETELANTRQELEKYKEAAKHSSIVGALQRHFSLTG